MHKGHHMTDQELSDLAEKAQAELQALEKALPHIDFGPLHKACEAIFDGFLTRAPGVVRPLGGGPK